MRAPVDYDPVATDAATDDSDIVRVLEQKVKSAD